MPNGHSVAEQYRQEAERMRREFPDEQTGRHLFEPRAEPPRNGNGGTVVAALTFWKLGAAVLAIVVGTIAASNWIEGRIKDRVAPVEHRLESIEGKLDKLIDRLVDK